MAEETGARWWVRHVIVPVIAGGGLITILLTLMNPPVTVQPQPDASLPGGQSIPADQNGQGKEAPPGPPVMGQLEVGINRQGMDVSAAEMFTPNAETCAELCRTNNDCKAMTYVVSHQTCWLKTGIPPAFPPGGPDYVSAVKQ